MKSGSDSVSRERGGGFKFSSRDSSATMFWQRAETSCKVRSRVGKLARARAMEAKEDVRHVRR